jgi:hypothetical protein
MKKKFFIRLAVLLLIVFSVTAFAGDMTSKEYLDIITRKVDANRIEVFFDSYGFQSAIRSEQNLGALEKQSSPIGSISNTFGFAAKSNEAKFFTIGTLFSETLAYFRSNDMSEAAKRLEIIQNELINLSAPGSLYNYVSRISSLMKRQDYSKEVVGELLSMLQPFLEDYSKTQGEDKLTLFRAGSWLTDMSLTASAGDKELLRQTGKLDYFRKEMKKWLEIAENHYGVKPILYTNVDFYNRNLFGARGQPPCGISQAILEEWSLFDS